MMDVPPARLRIVVQDVWINAGTALLVAGPVLLLERSLALVGLVLAAGVLLDLDHVAASRSLRMSAWLSLPCRPLTHSLTFAALMGLLLSAWRGPVWGWLVFAGLTSHVLRDAGAGATPILFPLRVQAIPAWVYPLGEALLFVLGLGMALWLR